MIIDTTASKFERTVEDLKTAPKKKSFHAQFSLEFKNCVVHDSCELGTDEAMWTTTYFDGFKSLSGNEIAYTFSSLIPLDSSFTFSSTPIENVSFTVREIGASLKKPKEKLDSHQEPDKIKDSDPHGKQIDSLGSRIRNDRQISFGW